MSESILSFLSNYNIPPEFAIFIISVLPVLELRGGLIAASAMYLPWFQSLIICFLGNMLPIPFILIFIRKIFDWMKTTKIFGKIAHKFEHRALNKSKKAKNKTIWGKIVFVFVLVAIPLPGTGAWTGALVASFMNMRLKHSIPAISAGVLAAGIIMLILAYFFPTVFGLK